MAAGKAETSDWDDDDEWPDDLWPDDEDDAAAGASVPAGASGTGAAGPAGGAGSAWPAPPPPGGGGPGRRLGVAGLAVIALLAAGAGAGALIAARDLTSAAPSASQPSSSSPARPGTGLPGPGSAAGEMLIGGTVAAVTATSITIGGPGREVTAAVTSSTRFTGKITSISGVKAGDQVTAQLTQNGGTITAVTVADPGQLPSGGSLP
jgi:hypothetical protein